MSTDAWIMLAILILMFVLLIWDKFPAWLIFMGTIAVCMTLGLAPEGDLLKGFGNSGVVTVAILFVVAAGMYTTGAITLLADRFIGLPKSLTSAQLKILGPTAVGSAFLNNTPLVAMMIPVVRDITRVTGLAAGKLYMPMSFASILGGASTLIGTSVNLILAGLILDQFGQEVGIFFPTKLGLPAALIGVAFIMLVGTRLLSSPQKEDEEEDVARRLYRAEFVVEESAPLIDKTLGDTGHLESDQANLTEMRRADGTEVEFDAETIVQQGDELVFAVEADAVPDLWMTIGFAPNIQPPSISSERYTHRLVEVVVQARARQIGQTVADVRQADDSYQAYLVALSRAGNAPKGALLDLRIEPGDTAVLEVTDSFFYDNRREEDFALTKRLRGYRVQRVNRAIAASVITLAMVGLAAFGVMSMLNAALLAALAMLLTGCIDVRRAFQSVEWETLVVLGAAIGLEAAVTATGLSAAIAGLLARIGGDSPTMALAAVFIGCIIMTNVITNAAAAAFMFPIAVTMAASLDVSFEPFAVILMLGCSYAFINPAGYQTNLMVQKPGNYGFVDYAKVGVPLTIIVGIVAIWLAPILYAF